MAFTLIELLITFGIVLLLIALSLPLAVNFFQSQELENFTYQLVQLLRQAQNQAMAVENDSFHGVYLTDDNFVLFKGQSYQNRDPAFDFVIEVPEDINSAGLNEIVFAKLTGLPSLSGAILLARQDKTATIEINEIGRINLEL